MGTLLLWGTIQLGGTLLLWGTFHLGCTLRLWGTIKAVLELIQIFLVVNAPLGLLPTKGPGLQAAEHG